MSPRDGHPDWNDLAALAEGRAPAGSADLHRHLAGCRSCAAAYAEAVRIATRLATAPESLAVPPHLAAAARGASPATVTPSRRGRPWLRLGGALAGALALLVVALALRPEPAGGSRRFPAIHAAHVEQAPARIVLPDLTPAPGSPPVVYRDGGAANLDAERDALASAYRDDPAAETAFWLGAGYLAANRIEAATALVREARHRHPDDRRLQILDSLASYRRSDLGRAETLLREILVRDPRDPAARFDLALVLQELGRGAEARAVLDAGTWTGDPWLARRVDALRDTLR